MTDEKENRRYFQFLTTDRAGEILVYDGIEVEGEETFVKFTDGSRCNEKYILPLGERNARGNTVMAEVESPDNKWSFQEKWVGRQEEKWATNADGERVCVQPFVRGRKKIKLIPPRPPKPKSSKFGGEIVYVDSQTGETKKKDKEDMGLKEKSSTSKPDIQPAPQKKQEPQISYDDPVWLMMDKAKKFDTEVPVSITISLPTKSLYDVARESFENGGKKVVEYIISNIDDGKLKESLKEALYEAYEDDSSNYEEIEEESQDNSNNEQVETHDYKPENDEYEDYFKHVEISDYDTQNVIQKKPQKKEGSTKSNVKKDPPKEKKAASPPPTEPQKVQNETSEVDGQELFEPEVVEHSYEGKPQLREDSSENNE